MQERDDSTLILAILGGDTARFAEVVRCYDEAARRIVGIHQRGAARDSTQ